MHDAYEVSSLLKLTEQIESIAAYDDNLLVGTRQGHLLMYLVVQSPEGQKYKVQVLRYHKTFSKKPIQQIEVIPEHNLLLCLSDNMLVVHDINIINFPVVQTLPQTKGATLFALDSKITISLSGKTSVIRLCIAVKRKLQLYYWKHGEFKSLAKDITIGDIPKVMMWGETMICVGYKEEYIFYDFTGNQKEQFLTSGSRSLDPCMAKLSDTTFILARDNTSFVVDETNPSLNTRVTLKWNEPLTGAAWDNPYVLGLLTDQVIVQTIEPNAFVQSLSELHKARLLCRCRRGLLYAASVSQVWRIGAVDITKQRLTLLKEKKFQLALNLTNVSDESEDEKKQMINSIQMLYALDLFDNKKFSDSMKIFLQLETDASEVIKLFPELSPDNSSKTPTSSEPGIKSLDADGERGLQALIEYLTETRHKVQKSNNELKKVTDKNVTDKNVTDKNVTDKNVTDKKLNEIEKEAAIKKNNLLLETIDTTLLKCYLQTNDAFVAPLLRLNNCRLEEAEQVLLQHGKYSELIILYQTKGQHTKALQLLKDQAKQVDSSLKGYHKSKTYLQHLGAENLNLIFQFSDWVINEYPEEGLKIFTEDIVEVENLPRAKVLDFFLREHESLVIPYLEHVIHVWDEDSPVFHNAFVRMLREKVMDTKDTYTEGQRQHMKTKLLAFLEKSNYYTPETVLIHFPQDSLFEERAVVLGKLDAHEQALSIYIHILGDVQRAIKYCDAVSEKNKESKKDQDVYVILIRMLVNPSQETLPSGPLSHIPRSPLTAEPDLDTALTLLEKHADKIEPMKALAVLPDSVPISRIRKFLESALHNQLNNRRRAQVLKGLLYAEHLQVQELKMVHESQSVVIADYNVCPVCKKRFGHQSAFVRYPNGDIVHYSCQDRKTNAS